MLHRPETVEHLFSYRTPSIMSDLGLFLAQLIVVLSVARLAGWLMQRVGQPAVVGEMMAGLALGPSLFGALTPELQSTIFPADKVLPLGTLSQLGVVLFMFVVGLRLDLSILRQKASSAVAVSHASIVAPFLLGLALAWVLHAELAPVGVPFLPFALFLGAAMSITAFPVLARILAERNLLNSHVGAVSIAAAAVDDATAWCILAGVVAVANATSQSASAWTSFGVTLGSTIAYVMVLALVVRPLLAARASVAAAKAALRGSTGTSLVTPQVVSAAIVGALASAWSRKRWAYMRCLARSWREPLRRGCWLQRLPIALRVS